VRVTAETHPLFGQLLWASAFTRLNLVVHLIVALPDGSPGTIRAAATDVFGEGESKRLSVTLDVDGLRELRRVVALMRNTARPGGRSGQTQIGSPRP
jgi:hypothetical protein